MADQPQATPAAIAMNRFGLGARAGEAAPSDPKQWLMGQLGLGESAYRPMAEALDAQQSSLVLAAECAERQRAIRDAQGDDKQAVRKTYNEKLRDTYRAAVNARFL